MLEEILRNTAKLYFPYNVSELDEIDRYNNSIEHKNLCNLLVLFDKKHSYEGAFNDISEEFKRVNTEMIFHDVTNFNACDRSFNFQLTKMDGNHLHSICLNISVIIPNYTLYILDAVVDQSKTKWIEAPKENKKLEALYFQEIVKIKEFLQNKYKINEFPADLLDKKLPDISRGFIKFGDFTFFNAFFMDEFYTRL